MAELMDGTETRLRHSLETWRGNETGTRRRAKAFGVSGTVSVAWIEAPSKRRPSTGRRQSSILGSIAINGERFRIYVERGTVFLRHPTWSLMGSGMTVFQAQQDLLSEASELYGVLSRKPVSSFSAEGLRLREFVYRAHLNAR